MPSVINTNISSIIAQNNLAKTSNALQTNIERLSSGFRVNNAADDAAGFAIANRLDSQVRGMVVASRNANDAISFSQTVSGALSEISNNLQRMRELAVQAANGSNSFSDTSILNLEFNQLQTEVARIQNSTTFNSVNVFSTINKVIQVGANTGSNDRVNIQGITLNNVKALSRNSITDGATTSTAQELLAAINSAVATATGSEGKKINDVYNAIVDAINSSQKLSYSSKDSAIDLLGKIKQAYFSAYAQPAFATLTYFAIDATSLLTVNQNPGTYSLVSARSYLTSGFIPDAPSVEVWNPSTGQGRIVRGVEAGVGVGRVYESAPSSVTRSQSNALDSVTAIDLALKEVNTASAQHGAVQNRLSAVINNLTAFSQSQIAAKSRIVDADFAAETAQLSSNSILQQSGSAMMAQANQSSSNVLALLKGL